jgi:FK506-binding protein 4/5
MAHLFGSAPVIETVDVTSDGGIKKAVLVKGDGAGTPQTGNEVWAHYVGKLDDGTDFDSSRKRGAPFKFMIGLGQVIAGWDQGFASMSKGEKAVLTITSQYGYGARGAGGVIPPNATLHFEVELIDFGSASEVAKRQGVEEGGWCSVQ